MAYHLGDVFNYRPPPLPPTGSVLRLLLAYPRDRYLESDFLLDEHAPGYQVVLDSGPVVTVRWVQISKG